MRLWEQERKKHDKSGWENGDSNEVTTKRKRAMKQRYTEKEMKNN